MDAIGSVTLDSAGAVPQPSTVPISIPTSGTESGYNKHSRLSMSSMPAQRGVMLANGTDPIRHFSGGVLYKTGLLAPRPDKTLTISTSASRAYTIYTIFSPNVVANNQLNYLINSGTNNEKYGIYWRTSSQWNNARQNQVYFDGTNAHALSQLKKFINQTGIEGYDYKTQYDFSSQLIAGDITNNEKLRIDAISYGTAANNWVCIATGQNPAQFRFADSSGTVIAQFTGGANGTGSSPSPGVYLYGYTYVRTADGAESGMSTVSEIDNGGGGQVTLSWTAPTDSTVDYVRIYRTLNGGGIFYRVADVPVGTTSLVDTYSDSAISGFDATPYDPSIFRTYRAGLPVSVKHLAQYQGRWFGAGADVGATYEIGSITATNGLYTVDANLQLFQSDSGLRVVPKFRSVFEGWQFKATTNGTSYQVISVNETANQLVLDRPFEDANIISGSYEIKDVRDPYELYWSEPGLPNNWMGSLKGPSSPDGMGCTGLYAAFGSLIYFTRQNVWRISGSDGVYQVVLVSDKCGCISNQSIVMDGRNMYWLGMDGIYAWNGAGEPVNITTPPQQDASVRGQDATIARVSLSHAHKAYGVVDQAKREIRWFLPLDGSRYNNYALVLDAQNAVFSLDTCEDVTTACTVQGPDGADYLLTGDITGAIYQQNLSTSDGCYDIEPVQSVSSSTTRTVTVSGTPFSTSSNGYWGCPVWHVNASGLFVRSCVATNTNNTLTYRRFMPSSPSASTQFVIGGILMWIQTGRFDFGDRHREKIVPACIVSHSPDSDGQYLFFYSYDSSAWTIPSAGWTYGDLTLGSSPSDFGARRRFRVRKQAFFHGYGIACVEPGCSPKFGGITIEVRGPSNLEL